MQRWQEVDARRLKLELTRNASKLSKDWCDRSVIYSAVLWRNSRLKLTKTGSLIAHKLKLRSHHIYACSYKWWGAHAHSLLVSCTMMEEMRILSTWLVCVNPARWHLQYFNSSRNHEQYWAGRTLPPNKLSPNIAANDLRCSEMPHYCRVVIRA